MAQTDAPFLASQLEFYKTHNAKLLELQASRGSSVDPSSFMPSSKMFDELMGAFNSKDVKSSASAAPSASLVLEDEADQLGAGDGATTSESSPSETENMNIAMGTSLSNNFGSVLGGIAGLITGDALSLGKAVATIGMDAISGYNAINAFSAPAPATSQDQMTSQHNASLAALAEALGAGGESSADGLGGSYSGESFGDGLGGGFSGW